VCLLSLQVPPDERQYMLIVLEWGTSTIYASRTFTWYGERVWFPGGVRRIYRIY